MSKYRIKIETTISDNVRYTVERKGWFFWSPVVDYWEDCDCTKVFKTLREAEIFIEDRTLKSTYYRKHP